ncbi:MAG: hypothetical protein JWP14_1212 [Frankiales bacterium]|nr:hypothetical protein [Frankiales bacterium]
MLGRVTSVQEDQCAQVLHAFSTPRQRSRQELFDRSRDQIAPRVRPVPSSFGEVRMRTWRSDHRRSGREHGGPYTVQ